MFKVNRVKNCAYIILITVLKFQLKLIYNYKTENELIRTLDEDTSKFFNTRVSNSFIVSGFIITPNKVESLFGVKLALFL